MQQPSGSAEALPLLLTLSSGVQGFTTIHAGSARQALTRLRFICQLSDLTSDLPFSALNTLVTEAIDVVVHCGRTPLGPRVMSILAVEDLAGGIDTVHFTATDVFVRSRPDRPIEWSGLLPARLTHVLEEHGVDIRSKLGHRAANGARA